MKTYVLLKRQCFSIYDLLNGVNGVYCNTKTRRYELISFLFVTPLSGRMGIKMKIITEFTLGFQETNKKIQNDIAKELYQWRRKIKTYRTGERIISSDLYRMDENDPMFIDITKFALRFPEEVDLQIYEQTVVYNEKDVKEAVAFIPDFKRYWCEEYDDRSREFEECRFCHALLKEKTKTRYIRPKGFVKNKANEYGVLKLDNTIVSKMIMPKLFEKIIEKGVSERYFRPIYSKSKKVLAYELTSDNILPEHSYIDLNYSYKSTCSQCDTINYEVNEKAYRYIHKKISKKAVHRLQPVNITKEYYCHQPLIMINKELHDIIRKYVPDAEFFPVFQNDL